MNTKLQIDSYENPSFIEGAPPQFSALLLPYTPSKQAVGPWGAMCYQEVATDTQILDYFLFRFTEAVSLIFAPTDGKFQALVSLKGQLCYEVNGVGQIHLREKEYTLYHSAFQGTKASFAAEETCVLFHASYKTDAHRDLLHFFPVFRRQLRKSTEHLKGFLHPPRTARFSVHDSIRAIWQDSHTELLQKKHVALRLEQSLFSLLAQTYYPNPISTASRAEREAANQTREIVLRDLTANVSSQAIAAELHVSVGFLKRAFAKVYGMGIYHYLRQTRMERAHQMLIEGMSLKAVALEVGMRPKNFPKEFKSFYGYTVTQLKRGMQ